MVIDNNLLNIRKQIEESKHLTKSQKQIQQMLRPYQRFMEKKEYEELLHLLYEEVAIKEKLEEYHCIKEKGGFSPQQIEKVVYREQLPKLFPKLFNYKSREPEDIDGFQFLNNLTKQQVPSGMEIEEETLSPEEFCKRELQLCEDNGVEIDDYIALKEILIRTGLQKGYVNKEDFQRNVNFKNKNFLDQIMDLHEEFDLIQFKGK